MRPGVPDSAPASEIGDSPGPAHAQESLALGPPILPLIDGEPAGGSGPGVPCINPATGEPFARIGCAGPEDLSRAVESAAFHAPMLRGMSFDERARVLRRLADLVHDSAESIAGLISLEQGKPYAEALALEILPALDHLRFLAEHGQRLYSGEGIDARQPLFAHKRAHVLYDPLGVVALVTPSSLPFALPLIQVGAAIAMGNAVVLKPSERTPLTALRVGELCLDAGLPPGLVNVVPAMPEDTMHLAADPRVDKVFMAGSKDAGQSVMVTAGCAARPVVLSLGGNHPSIVAADADLERAARGIVWGATANAGQNCGAVERVYVEQQVAARFLDLVVAEAGRVRMGDPSSGEVELGPLVSARRRERVHRQVRDAVDGGARLLHGGVVPDGRGYFYPATVLLGPPDGSEILREETLGPVIPIVVVDTLERALLLANESSYALTASGWTTSATIAERLMVGIQAGVVTVNDVLYSFGEPASTWSGFRDSGLGHTHGMAGLREMCRQRFVSYDPAPAEAPVLAYPYDGKQARLVESAIATLHARGKWRRWRAMLRLLRLDRFRARVPTRSFTVARKARSK